MKSLTLNLSGTIESKAETLAAVDSEEEGLANDTFSLARALTIELRRRGVNVQVASVAFAPRSGTHGSTETRDLLAPVEVKAEEVIETKVADAEVDPAPPVVAPAGGI